MLPLRPISKRDLTTITKLRFRIQMFFSDIIRSITLSVRFGLMAVPIEPNFIVRARVRVIAVAVQLLRRLAKLLKLFCVINLLRSSNLGNSIDI